MQSAQDANGNWQWWTDALYQAVPDLNNYFDGVAVHPYGTDTTTLHPEIAGQPYNNYDSLQRIQDIHQQFINHGAANKPFWITEIGWSTCTNDPELRHPRPTGHQPQHPLRRPPRQLVKLGPSRLPLPLHRRR